MTGLRPQTLDTPGQKKHNPPVMRSPDYENRRQVNGFLTLLDLTCLSPETVAVPDQTWMRICTVCDLQCPFCERQHVRPIDSGYMDLEKFKNFASKMTGMRRVHLFGLGEPFLNKRFFEYLEICHQQGVEASTTTHGMHLDESLARRLIDSGIEELAVSMDAPHSELFNRLRKGADFAVVCENVRRMVKLKDKMGAVAPDLLICCALSTENVDEMAGMVEMTHFMGVNRIVFSDLTVTTPEHTKYSVTGSKRVDANLEKAKEKGKETGVKVEYFQQNTGPWIDNDIHIQGIPHGCAMAWTNLVVEREGTTRFCCYIKDDMPNAFEHSPHEVMNSPSHVEIRKDLLQGKLRKECVSCPNLEDFNPERIKGLLMEARDCLDRLEVSEEERKQLRALLDHYRALAIERFGMKFSLWAEETKRGIKAWLKRHLPQKVRDTLRLLYPRS
jgi:MoaA/NifB/PqqE/SkfB family radical SAM enzyme